MAKRTTNRLMSSAAQNIRARKIDNLRKIARQLDDQANTVNELSKDILRNVPVGGTLPNVQLLGMSRDLIMLVIRECLHTIDEFRP